MVIALLHIQDGETPDNPGRFTPQIAALGFTSEDRAREVIHNFNADGLDSLYPRYAGGRPPKFDEDQRREIKQIALGRPVDYDLPFSTWSLTKLARREGDGRRHQPRGSAPSAP